MASRKPSLSTLTPTATHFVGTRPCAQGEGDGEQAVGCRAGIVCGADHAAGDGVGANVTLANLANLANFSATGRGKSVLTAGLSARAVLYLLVARPTGHPATGTGPGALGEGEQSALAVAHEGDDLLDELASPRRGEESRSAFGDGK